jgi:DNA (cytosine-5)-methyltransferase 1
VKSRPSAQQMSMSLAHQRELVSSHEMSNACLPDRDFRFVDLFAGVGGFHHALADLGGECVLTVELDEECRRVYRSSFPDMPPERIHADIRSFTRASPDPDAEELSAEEIRDLVPEHDVLCAGFPCQPFSKSGAQQGVRDRTRGTLFFDVMSIVLARRPELVILENVRNLAGPRHADTWATIVESLREAGYQVADDPVVLSPHLLSPELGGAPQVRDRVFVMARRLPPVVAEEERVGPVLLRREASAGWDPDRWDIRDFLDEVVDREYSIRDVERTWFEAWQAFVRGIPDDTLPGFPIWVDAFTDEPEVTAATPKWKADILRKNSAFYLRHRPFLDHWLQRTWGPDDLRVADFPASRRKLEWQARKAQPARRDRDLEGLVAHLRPSGIRVKPATYLPALVAITQTSILGPKVSGTDWRRLSPQEAARLQAIPFDGFAASGVSDKAIYKQLGNAVNVGVVRHVAHALFEAAGWLDCSEVLDLRDAELVS